MAASRQNNRSGTASSINRQDIPFSGPNAVDPALMTPDGRRAEIAAIMMHGVLRRLSRASAEQGQASHLNQS